MTDADPNALSVAEQKYFETGGTADPTAAPEAAPEPIAEPVAAVEEHTGEAATEPAETAHESTADDGKPQKVVPLAALKEARTETKELRDKHNREMAKLTERLEALQRLVTQPPPEKPAEPSWDEKPIEAGKLTAQRLQLIEQERAQERYVNQLSGAFNQAEAVFASQQADYHQAITALKLGRDAELATMFPDSSPMERQEHIRREALMLADTYLKRGENPAQAAYRMAVARGWKAPSAEPKAIPAPALAKVDETKRLATVAKGKDASKSLGSAGSPADGHLTVERLLEMDDDDFGKIDEKTFRRLAGG